MYITHLRSSRTCIHSAFSLVFLSLSSHQQNAYADIPFLTYEKAIVFDVDSSLFKATLFGDEQTLLMRQPVDAQADLIAFVRSQLEVEL